MAWKRSSVRSRPGPPILQQRSGPTLEALAREDERHSERTARITAILRDDVVDRRISPKICRFRSQAGIPQGLLSISAKPPHSSGFNVLPQNIAKKIRDLAGIFRSIMELAPDGFAPAQK